MMEEHEQKPPLKDHFIPNDYTNPSCIRMPAATGHFEIKPSTIAYLPTFYGKSNEDPYQHLNDFADLCNTFNVQHLSEEALKLRLFPFSLKDKAKQWLNSLPTNSVTSWAQLRRTFLTKFYPIGKTMEMRNAITNFTMIDGEPFHEAWERFTELQRKCPHHEILPWQLVKSFYDGLSDRYRQMIDSACGGTFFNKTEDEANELFETLAENSQHHASSSRRAPSNPFSAPKRGGICEVGQALDGPDPIAVLSRKLDQLLARGQSNTPTPSIPETCALCASPTHFVSDCPQASHYPEFVQDQVNALQGFQKPGNDPFSNTYNPGWRNHPNLSWKPQTSNSSPFAQTQRPNGPNLFQQSHYQPSPPPPRNSEFEEKVLSLLQTNTSAFQSLQSDFQAHTQILHSHTQSIAKLESQMGQLAQTVGRRDEGRLPSQPVTNPKGQYGVESSNAHDHYHEQVKAITTLRSGREVDNRVDHHGDSELVRSPDKGKAPASNTSNEDSTTPKPPESVPVAPYMPRVPYPTALNDPSPFGKKSASTEEMLDTFRQVKINLPLLDAIKQIPAYAKFLKDLCTQKRKAQNVSKKVFLTEQVSSILRYQTVPKFRDPGVPTISCVIGDHSIDRALLDLGASVNLLPYSVYKQIGLGELKPTTVSLQLADRSVKVPRGIIEDVLVKVDKFFFPVDFLVLDMEPVHDPSRQIPVILGRPFLATAHACINCRTGVMDLTFGNMTMRLNVFRTVHQSSQDEDCYRIDVIDGPVDVTLPQTLNENPLECDSTQFDVSTLDIDFLRREEEINRYLSQDDALPECDLDYAKSIREIEELLNSAPAKDSDLYTVNNESCVVPSLVSAPQSIEPPFPIDLYVSAHSIVGDGAWVRTDPFLLECTYPYTIDVVHPLVGVIMLRGCSEKVHEILADAKDGCGQNLPINNYKKRKKRRFNGLPESS